MPGMGRFPPDGAGTGVLPGSAAEILKRETGETDTDTQRLCSLF